MKAQTILETIGNTPHVRINRLFANRNVEIWMKLERANPGGSIKDRIGLAMIEDAEQRGLISANAVIVEPTSGNTGIALALVAATKGYRLILTMPESMSLERRRYLAALGAELVLTPKEKGCGRHRESPEIVDSTPGAWMPQQFENPANVEIHRRTTAQEILADFPGRAGLSDQRGRHRRPHHRLRRSAEGALPDLKAFAVEPSASPILSGGQRGPHPIQGIGAGFVPAVLNTTHPGWHHSGGPRRCLQVRRALRQGGRHLHRHFLRRVAGGGVPETAGNPRRQPRADLLLRYRRALPVGGRAVRLNDRSGLAESEPRGPVRSTLPDRSSANRPAPPARTRAHCMSRSQTVLPAEWAPQDAILLTWPHADSDWRPWLDQADSTFAALAAAISRYQSVIIACHDRNHSQHVLDLLKSPPAPRGPLSAVRGALQRHLGARSRPDHGLSHRLAGTAGLPLQRLGRQVRLRSR